MNKIVGLFLAIVLAIGLFACGGSSSSSKKANEQVTITPNTIVSSVSAGSQSVTVKVECSTDDIINNTCAIDKGVIGLNGNTYEVPLNISMKAGEQKSFDMTLLTSSDLLLAPFSYLNDVNPSTSNTGYTSYSEVIGNIATKVVAYGTDECVEDLSVSPGEVSVKSYAGGAATYTVSGGVAPYNISTSNPSFPPSVTSLNTSGSSFQVVVAKNTLPQTVTYTVKDSSTASVTVKLTIASEGLTVTPATQAANNISGGTFSFVLMGGTPPYNIYSNNPSILPDPNVLDTSSSSFKAVIPKNTVPQTVSFSVRDQAGSTATATITISSSALGVIPGSQSISSYSGGSPVFTVTGGTPPYTVYPSSASFPATPPQVANSGETFSVLIAPYTQPQALTYTVRDSNSASATATLNVIADILSVVPEKQYLNSADGGKVSFTVLGGMPPYSVFSSNSGLPANPASVTNLGGTFEITVPKNTTPQDISYTVHDVSSNSYTVHLVISSLEPFSVLPSSQQINSATGGTASFSVFGGTAPYSIFTDSPSTPPVPTAIDVSGGSFQVTIPSGFAEAQTIKCTVKDSAGLIAVTTINIGNSAPATVSSVGKARAMGTTCSPIKEFTVSLPNYTLGTLQVSDGKQILDEKTFGVLSGDGSGTVYAVSGGYEAKFRFNSAVTKGVPITASYLLPLSPLKHAPSGQDARLVYGTATYSYQSGFFTNQSGVPCARLDGTTITLLIPIGYQSAPLVAVYSGDPFNASGGDIIAYADGVNSTFTLKTKYAPIIKSSLSVFTDGQPAAVSAVNESAGTFTASFAMKPDKDTPIKASYVVSEVDTPISVTFFGNPGGQFTFSVPLKVTK